MQKVQTITRKFLTFILVAVLAGSSPAMAVSAADEPVANTPVPAEEAPRVYTYNEETKLWDSDKWTYDPSTGTYVPTPPAQPAPTAPTPQVPTPSSTTPVSGQSPSTSSNTPATAGAPTSSGQNNGPDAAAKAKQNQKSSSSTTTDTKASVHNTLDSTAKSGDANVVYNVSAGDAKTGDGVATTTVVNSIHSTADGDTKGISQFTSDIYGNVTGDIVLYPAIDAATSKQNKDKLAVTNSAEITNDIHLQAGSGNATVAGNTSAGDATTGNAHAVANVVNLINTIIAANKSFVGTINIHGNLDGDILVSPDFIPQLIASNATDKVDPNKGPLSTTLNDAQSVINNIQLNAGTGNASVANNTQAGSATTGDATTNLTILNLTNRQVVAANSLLVFVNVLGTWVGMIVDAPAGATAAMLSNGVTSNTTGVQSTLANTDSSITNNITVGAQSGDAAVTGNTQAGNATSGDASASANIANLVTSSFSVSDWFGVLFINVLGSWYGSFGVDTENGTVVPIGGDAVPATQASATVGGPAFRFGFVPRGQTQVGTQRAQQVSPYAHVPAQASSEEQQTAAVLAAMSTNSGGMGEVTGASYSAAGESEAGYPFRFKVVVASIIATTLVGIAGILRRRFSFDLHLFHR